MDFFFYKEFELDTSWLHERVELGIPDSFKVQTLIKSYNKDFYLFFFFLILTHGNFGVYWVLPTYLGRKFVFNIFSYGKEERLKLIARGMLNWAQGVLSDRHCSASSDWRSNPGSCHLWLLWRCKCQTIPVCLGGDVPLSTQTLGRRDETDPLGWVGHPPAKWDICAPDPLSVSWPNSRRAIVYHPLVGCSRCTWPQHRILPRTPRQGYLVWFQLSRGDMGSHSKTCYLYR